MDEVGIRLRQPGLSWWVLGITFLVVTVVLAQRYVPWIVFGLFIYYVARPISRRIERRIGSGTLAAAVTLLLVVLPVVVLLSALLFIAIGQLSSLVSQDLLRLIVARLPVDVANVPSDPADLTGYVVNLLEQPSVQSALGAFGATLGGFMGTLYNAFLSLLLAFFLLFEDRHIIEWAHEKRMFEGSLSTDYLRAVDRGLNSVFFGYTLTIFAIMILSAIIYNVVNLLAPASLSIPNTILLAVITGVMTLVPLVGRSIVYFLIVGIMAVQALAVNPAPLWYPIAFLLVMVLGFDNVVRTYIRPYLSGGVYPMGLIMFAYLLGPPLFGWYGIFLGPLLLVLIASFVSIVLPEMLHPEEGGPGIEEAEEVPEETEQFSGIETEDTETETDRGDVQPG
ncbi:MAG: AI-2E family transporter [Halobacteriota archaeon]